MKKLLLGVFILCALAFVFVSCAPEKGDARSTVMVELVLKGIPGMKESRSIALSFGDFSDVSFEYIMAPMWDTEAEGTGPVLNPSNGPTSLVPNISEWVRDPANASYWKALSSPEEEVGEASIDQGQWFVAVRAMGVVDGQKVCLYEGNICVLITIRQHSFIIPLYPTEDNGRKGEVHIQETVDVPAEHSETLVYTYRLEEYDQFGTGEKMVVPPSSITLDEEAGTATIDLTLENVPLRCYHLSLTVYEDEFMENCIMEKKWMLQVCPTFNFNLSDRAVFVAEAIEEVM